MMAFVQKGFRTFFEFLRLNRAKGVDFIPMQTGGSELVAMQPTYQNR
jgi:hypothetical protein